MVRPINVKAEEAEKAIQKAIARVKDGTYRSIDHAAKELGVSKATLHRRLKAGKSRSEAKEPAQRLTPQEEKAMASWISSSTATGNPVHHDFIREMAEKLIQHRMPNEIVPQLGSSWVPSFLRRHRHLKTKMTRAIETARIKDVTKEQVLHFNDEFRRIIREHNIRLDDIFNVDETGFYHLYSGLIIGSSIGTMQTSNVVVDVAVSDAYEAQPGRQEWLTVIECISATGEKIPPYVIFKGQNLMSNWLPKPMPKGWMFAANASGWTNNYHGMKWIEHFESATQKQLQSPDDYRLLLCDGHDSHVSADFVSFCIHNRIDLLLLPPHSSHLLQPLDVGVFSPLKHTISKQISRFVRSGISRIQKVEWVERFIVAREEGITKQNILAGWRGAGLFPENMHRILVQLADYEKSAPQTTPPQSRTAHPALYPNSCRPDPSSIHSVNQAFLAKISKTDLDTPYKTQVRRLCNFMEEFQAETVMLREELKDVKEINGRRKERECGKRHILKDKPVASTEEIEKALRKHEEAIKAKKKGKGKRKVKQPVSSKDETDSDADDSSDSQGHGTPKIFDCIEVAE